MGTIRVNLMWSADDLDVKAAGEGDDFCCLEVVQAGQFDIIYIGGILGKREVSELPQSEGSEDTEEDLVVDEVEVEGLIGGKGDWVGVQGEVRGGG